MFIIYENCLYTHTIFCRADAAEEILGSMASECVEPDARCYRFAAEAFRGTGDDSVSSPEVERLLDLARKLEANEEGKPGEDTEGRDRGGERREGRLDLGGVLDGTGLSGTSGLEMLLEERRGVEFTGPEDF